MLLWASPASFPPAASPAFLPGEAPRFIVEGAADDNEPVTPDAGFGAAMLEAAPLPRAPTVPLAATPGGRVSCPGCPGSVGWTGSASGGATEAPASARGGCGPLDASAAASSSAVGGGGGGAGAPTGSDRIRRYALYSCTKDTMKYVAPNHTHHLTPGRGGNLVSEVQMLSKVP